MAAAGRNGNYKTPQNLTRRADFNARYSNISWFTWIADHAEPPSGYVLDIGCGPGWVWKALSTRWSPSRIVLADTSQGMLDAAQSRLEDSFQVETCLADAMDLPFEADSFDWVLAMHMLYHVDVPETALSEIKRVLKPDGIALITTVHEDDLAPIAKMSRICFGSAGGDLIFPVFGSTIADQLLNDAFDHVSRHDICDTFEVDETQSVVDYVTSFPPGASADAEAVETFRRMFEAARLQAGGTLPMKRKQTLFQVQCS